MDYSFYIGHWQNSNAPTKGIDSFTFSDGPEGPLLQVKGVESGYFPGDWGKVPVHFLGTAPDSKVAAAFEATYDHGGQRRFLAGNINKGLIIIAIYARQATGPSLFLREFYFKLT